MNHIEELRSTGKEKRNNESERSAPRSVTYLDEVIDTREPALLVIALLPRLAVSDRHPVGQRARLGEVDHPRADVLAVVNDQNTAADHLLRKRSTASFMARDVLCCVILEYLVRLEVRRVAELLPDVDEPREQLVLHVRAPVEERAEHRLDRLARVHRLQFAHRRLALELEVVKNETH